MRTNQNNHIYQDPIFVLGAQVTPRLTGSSPETLATFDLGETGQINAALSVHEYLTTALTGTNNDLTFIAKVSGDQSVTVTYADPGGATAALSVAVVGSAITVNLGRAAGAIVSTAAQVKAAIEASAAASALVVVALASGNDGTGVVTALTQTALAGPAGTNPTLDVELETSLDQIQWYGINAVFTQKTALGVTEPGVFGSLGFYGRWKVTVGGTGSPQWAFSIVAGYRP